MGRLAGWQGARVVERELERFAPTTVGRSPSCSISIVEGGQTVSRVHCRIDPTPGGGHRVVDLASANGTYVNGGRIESAVLEDNDVVRLGEVELVYLAGQVDAWKALHARIDPTTARERARRTGGARADADAPTRRSVLSERLLRFTLDARDVESDHELQRLLGALLEEAMTFASCDWGAVYLSGEQPVVVRPGDTPPPTSAVEAALEEAHRTHLSCLRPCPGGSIFCLPLSRSAADPTTGALVLCAAEGLDDLDDAGERLLETVAAQAAGVARRACLYREATTDHLTRLATRAMIERVVSAELQRVGSRRPTSVILFDLDHFKRINDVHGHPVGDEVLREVARRARAALPASATVGRWGGEEFLVVLPGVGAAEAAEVAARIAHGVKASEIGGVEERVTASLGVAAFPDDGQTLDQLVRCADRALYAAKTLGRDRVVVYASELELISRVPTELLAADPGRPVRLTPAATKGA